MLRSCKWWVLFSLSIIRCSSGPIPAQFSVTGPTTLTNDTCSSSAFAANIVDSSGVAVVSPSDLEVFFSLDVKGVAVSGGFFYSDSGCENRVNSLILKKATSSVNFYFKGKTTGQMGLTADDGQDGIQPGTLDVTFQ